MIAIDDIAGPKKARVEIIPLIDVIFFLLATFVLFTLTLHRVKVVEAEFPHSVDQPRGTEDPTTAFIQASADGTFHWKVGRESASEPITAVELPLKLEAYKTSVPRPRVLVRSDQTARLGALVVALDEVRKAKIRDVAVETVVSAPGS